MTGYLLYHARAKDRTMLVALNIIGSTKNIPTKKSLKQWKQLLDYAATYPDTVIRYRASDMILRVESDTVYGVAPKACSCIASFFHLFSTSHQKNHAKPKDNILIKCRTI